MASNNTLANNDKKLSSERFVSFIDDDVEKFLEAEENKNTRGKTVSIYTRAHVLFFIYFI